MSKRGFIFYFKGKIEYLILLFVEQKVFFKINSIPSSLDWGKVLTVGQILSRRLRNGQIEIQIKARICFEIWTIATRKVLVEANRLCIKEAMRQYKILRGLQTLKFCCTWKLSTYKSFHWKLWQNGALLVTCALQFCFATMQKLFATVAQTLQQPD